MMLEAVLEVVLSSFAPTSPASCCPPLLYVSNINLLTGYICTLFCQDGYTPIHGACFQGRPQIARALIAHGVDPRTPHSDGYEPAFRATWGRLPRHAETVMVMLEAGVPLDAEDGRGGTLQDAIGGNEHARRMLHAYEGNSAEL